MVGLGLPRAMGLPVDARNRAVMDAPKFPKCLSPWGGGWGAGLWETGSLQSPAIRSCKQESAPVISIALARSHPEHIPAASVRQQTCMLRCDHATRPTASLAAYVELISSSSFGEHSASASSKTLVDISTAHHVQAPDRQEGVQRRKITGRRRYPGVQYVVRRISQGRVVAGGTKRAVSSVVEQPCLAPPRSA